jgi:uncharacterized surface protein with fasciclin (FAS1) repeats
MKIRQTLLAIMAAASMGLCHAASENIVVVAVGAGQFNTLVAAVKAADLVEVLSEPVLKVDGGELRSSIDGIR